MCIKRRDSNTFAAFSEANNVCNTEAQTNPYNQEVIRFKPDDWKYSKDDPSNSLHDEEKKRHTLIITLSTLFYKAKAHKTNKINSKPNFGRNLSIFQLFVAFISTTQSKTLCNQGAVPTVWHHILNPVIKNKSSASLSPTFLSFFDK